MGTLASAEHVIAMCAAARDDVTRLHRAFVIAGDGTDYDAASLAEYRWLASLAVNAAADAACDTLHTLACLQVANIRFGVGVPRYRQARP